VRAKSAIVSEFPITLRRFPAAKRTRIGFVLKPPYSNLVRGDRFFEDHALFLDRFAVMISAAMGLWSFQKVFAALLAVLVTVGLSVSATHAGDMTMKMPMQPAMASSGLSDCRDCDHGDTGKMKSAICVVICAVPVIAMLPQAPPVEVAEVTTIVPLPEDEVVNGRQPPPERYPPKTI
jgi:hypothetical protein